MMGKQYKAKLSNRRNNSWLVSRMLLVFLIVLTGCNPGEPQTSPPWPERMPNGQALLGWGGNSNGQIGDGSTSQRLTPALIDLKNISGIAASGSYSLALTADWRVLEWGGGKTTPTEVPDLIGVQSIAVGANHRLALKDGKVLAWGDNSRGQLGDGTTLPRSSPVQVVGLDKVLVIAAGGDQSFAIRSDFSLWSWGANDHGQLGDGTKVDRWTPVAVRGIKAIEVAASVNHTVALTTDLRVMGWGSNNNCQLLMKLTSVNSGTCPQNDYLSPIQTGQTGNLGGHVIATTNSLTFIVQSDGEVEAIGLRSKQFTCGVYYERGEFIFSKMIIPRKVKVQEVVAGTNHALFLTDKGEVWSEGSNLAGELGFGTTSITCKDCRNVVSPAEVRGVTKLAAGDEHSLAIVLGILDFSPSTLDFGNQPVGISSTSPSEITVTNIGLAPVTLYDISLLDSGDYSL